MSVRVLQTKAIKIFHMNMGPEMPLFRLTALVSFLIHVFSTLHHGSFVSSSSRSER
jgi:hypothetical protein